jgi:hypothetical protein
MVRSFKDTAGIQHLAGGFCAFGYGGHANWPERFGITQVVNSREFICVCCS